MVDLGGLWFRRVVQTWSNTFEVSKTAAKRASYTYVPEPRFRGESFAEGDASTDEDLTFLANLPNLGRRLATRQRICVLFKASVPSAGHLMLPLVSDRASAPPKPHLSGSVTSRPLTRNVLSPQQGALKLFI